MSDRRLTVMILGAACLLAGLTAPAQQLERGVAVVSEEAAGQLAAFSYREGPVSKLDFRGTAMALAASGKGEVEFQDGRSRIDVSVTQLPDPASLGPYSTYVLWAVGLDGRADNLGAIETRDGRGNLDASSSLSQFALIVTAEPHFAVSVPSRALVLQNLPRRVYGTQTMIPSLAERMDYRDLPHQLVAAGRHAPPPELVQARYALAIARMTAADQYATTQFAIADQRLSQAEAAAQSRKSAERRAAPRLAREAAQLAENARRAAVTGKAEAAAQAKAAEARAQAEAEAERARVLAEQKAEHEAELAREQAEREAAAREQAAAEQAAAAAAQEAAAKARADLVARLNRALPTRETERGIVAQIAGVQFASGAAALNGSAREALARFAGIVAVYPTMRFVIEGHTDNVGSYETNQALSLQRATAVRDYLTGQGVDGGSIEVRGIGPDQPIDDNATAAGRARNRRVEIVITGTPVAP